jgi:hypothetical protein
MSSATDSVSVPGPPPVSATMWSKICRNPLSDSTMLMVKKPAIIGNVMLRNCCHAEAPSRLAASYISVGTVCRPAM